MKKVYKAWSKEVWGCGNAVAAARAGAAARVKRELACHCRVVSI